MKATLLNKLETLTDRHEELGALLSDGEVIADQNETVLALATSVANLADNVDAVTAGTTGRLESACRSMERDSAHSVKQLDARLDHGVQPHGRHGTATGHGRPEPHLHRWGAL